MKNRADIAVMSKIAEFFPECDDIESATFDSLHIDSFALIELILALESAFAFEFEDDMLNLDTFQTLGQLAHYVEKRISDGSD
jgi:acyl carrier protein